MNKTDLRGVTVATVLPFEPTGEIDWKSYERLLSYCAVPDTVAAVFVNGHAGEATSLSSDERTAVIRRTREIIGARKPLLAGVIPHSVADAIEQARAAEAAGADCYVVFPPASLGGGRLLRRTRRWPFSRRLPRLSGYPPRCFSSPSHRALAIPRQRCRRSRPFRK